jgi:hypothetical protein
LKKIDALRGCSARRENFHPRMDRTENDDRQIGAHQNAVFSGMNEKFPVLPNFFK